MNRMIAFLTVAAVSASAFADADNLLYTVFRGGDTYADGTSVRPGEWYALAFLPAGSDGIEIAADATVVDSSKGEIVKVQQSPSEDAGLPVCFQVDAAEAESLGAGSWAAYLLDTRTIGENGAVSVAEAGSDGLPTAVNASRKLADAAIRVTKSSSPVAKSASGVRADVVTAVPADAPQPEITGIEVSGGKVRVRVSNTVPCLQYNLAGGGDVGSISGSMADSPKNGVAGGEIELVAPADSDCKFFRVKRN